MRQRTLLWNLAFFVYKLCCHIDVFVCYMVWSVGISRTYIEAEKLFGIIFKLIVNNKLIGSTCRIKSEPGLCKLYNVFNVKITYLLSIVAVVVLAVMGADILIIKLISGLIFVLRPLMQNFYVVDRTTTINSSQLNVEDLLNQTQEMIGKLVF